MSRQITIAIRSLVLASITLAGAACRSDGPIGPQSLPGPRAPSAPEAIVKPKPTLYFNGILFEGTHDASTGEIYSMNPDGSALYRITNDGVSDAYPDVSPTGPAFIWARFSGDGQTSEIFSQNLDGTKRKQLTSLGTVAIYPRYSPDGQRIAFTAVVPGSGPEIFTMFADGTGIARLTYSGRNSVAPSWSPDGSQIAFQSADGAGFPGVWVMYASGGQQKLLASCPPPGCGRPKWSPVANEIAVEHLDMSGIIVLDATTGSKIGYVPATATDYDMMPTWSKDGVRLIFSSLRSGNGTYDLYATEPVRRGDTMPPPVVRLTTLGGGAELSPAYSH
jgi:TolB protein